MLPVDFGNLDDRDVKRAAAQVIDGDLGVAALLVQPIGQSGGGGLVSTAGDYLRFCQMLLNGGELDGVRLLSPKSVQLMTVDHTGSLEGELNDSGYGFGLGFAVALDSGAIGELSSPGEYNWGGAAGTGFWVDPAEELIGVFMVQSIPHQTRLRYEFKNLVYQAMVE